METKTPQCLVLKKLNEYELQTKKQTMKTEKLIRIRFRNLILVMLCFCQTLYTKAQESAVNKGTKPSITVLNIDTKGLPNDPTQMGNMVRIELEKLNIYDVMDRYDVSYVIDKNKLNISNCYGKICLLEIGSIINSEKMLTGSAELIGETIIVTLRLIDVKTASIEKTQVNEFLNIPKELQSMVKISVRQLFGLTNEEPLINYLTKKNNFESSTNNPTRSNVNLSGPRSGFTYFTGQAGNVLQKKRSEGGYNSYPVMFQFGYQFEMQYLNEGNYQALFEFVPTISGFNQNIFIPSITIMNGFRNNKNGWEIAFGPTLSIVNKARGYYDANNVWHLEKDWTESNTANPYSIERRLDSRGTPELQAGFIVAVGKTFKSGKLNIPLNLYVVPNKDGVRAGVSFGFNAKRNK